MVRDVDVLGRGERHAPAGTDLGLVPAPEAAAYLLSRARAASGRPPREDAVLAAALADVDGLWRELLVLGRDRGIDRDVRRSALFWVAQDAGAAASQGIAALAADEQEDQEVREAAIFALSQRPASESVPARIDLARSAREHETRQAAMFWLAQSEDERVLTFFEEILPGRR